MNLLAYDSTTLQVDSLLLCVYNPVTITQFCIAARERKLAVAVQMQDFMEFMLDEYEIPLDIPTFQEQINHVVKMHKAVH